MKQQIRLLYPIIGLSILLWLLAAPAMARAIGSGGRAPGAATPGYLDLKDWNFTERGSTSLSGQWRFFWKELVPPDKVSDYPGGGNADVPGSWHEYSKSHGEKHGYASFFIRVNLGENPVPLALGIRNILTAYQIFINGKLVEQVGVVAKTRAAMTPEYRPVVIDLPEAEPVLDILIHVSNFHHRLGGIWANPVIGPRKTIYNEAAHRMALNIFMIGSIFIMGLYHLSLYVLRKAYTPPLYLGLFCSLITLRALVTNEMYLHTLFPGIPWEILVKLEYLGFYLAVPIFFMFIFSLFKEEVSLKGLRLVQLLGGGFSLLVLTTPVRIFSYSVLAYEGITLLVCIYLFHGLIRAVKHKREGAWAILFGSVFLMASVVNDMLHANSIIHSAYAFQAGMFVFVFSQAFVLSHRFSKTFLTVENQTRDLLGMNTSLTREIAARKKLETSLVESHENFKNSRIALILGLAKLAEYRDTDTGTHLERIREYVRILAEDLALTKAYENYITPDYIQDIYHSSILHDIGKIGIKDAILLKPGKLSDEEFEIMKTHTLIGGDAITDVASKIQTRSFLTLAKNIAYYHHERWDGKGYPKGLSAEDIPLCARIAALADVYDALTSERPYKKAFSHQKAMDIITSENNRQFDPDVVAAFLRQSDQIQKVRARLLKDGDHPGPSES